MTDYKVTVNLDVTIASVRADTPKAAEGRVMELIQEIKKKIKYSNMTVLKIKATEI